MVADWAARAQPVSARGDQQDSGHPGGGEGEAAEAVAGSGSDISGLLGRAKGCGGRAPWRPHQRRRVLIGTARRQRQRKNLIVTAHLDAMAQERVKMLQFMAKVEQRLAQREAEAEEREAREAEARAQTELLQGQIVTLKRLEHDRLRSEHGSGQNARPVSIADVRFRPFV